MNRGHVVWACGWSEAGRGVSRFMRVLKVVPHAGDISGEGADHEQNATREERIVPRYHDRDEARLSSLVEQYGGEHGLHSHRQSR